MTDQYFRDLLSEQVTFTRQLGKMLAENTKKSGRKPGDDKDVARNAKKRVDKFTPVNLGGNRKLKLKFNGFKSTPVLISELKW